MEGERGGRLEGERGRRVNKVEEEGLAQCWNCDDGRKEKGSGQQSKWLGGTRWEERGVSGGGRAVGGVGLHINRWMKSWERNGCQAPKTHQRLAGAGKCQVSAASRSPLLGPAGEPDAQARLRPEGRGVAGWES